MKIYVVVQKNNSADPDGNDNIYDDHIVYMSPDKSKAHAYIEKYGEIFTYPEDYYRKRSSHKTDIAARYSDYYRPSVAWLNIQEWDDDVTTHPYLYIDAEYNQVVRNAWDQYEDVMKKLGREYEI